MHLYKAYCNMYEKSFSKKNKTNKYNGNRIILTCNSTTPC